MAKTTGFGRVGLKTRAAVAACGAAAGTDNIGAPEAASSTPSITATRDAGITTDNKHHFALSGSFDGELALYGVKAVCGGADVGATIENVKHQEIDFWVAQAPNVVQCRFTVHRRSDGAASNTVTQRDTVIDLKPYWPQPDASTVIINRFDSNRIEYYRKEPAGWILGDYWDGPAFGTSAGSAEKITWADNWYYSINSKKGILEYRDDYPTSYGVDPTPRETPAYMPGYEIKWGNFQRVGDIIQDGKIVYANHPQKDPISSNKTTFVSYHPTFTVGGKVYKDVIRFDNIQVACMDSAASTGSADDLGPLDCPKTSTSSATMYMAPYMGFIKFQNHVYLGQLQPDESLNKQCTEPAEPLGKYGNELEYCK